MSKNRSTAFRATTLTYSSPAVDTASPVPTCFYNAFPDFNDEAADGSRSAFPRRAKYLLALDSMFLPSGMWVDRKSIRNRIDDDYLASMSPMAREELDIFINKLRNSKLRLPLKPELDKGFYVEALCEIPHKRLAATQYKWELRVYYLASFYTTLENHLVRGQTISVPLAASYRGSPLQRHFAAVKDAFKPTQLIDEAVALLVCVTNPLSVEAQIQEQTWAREEEAENPGFTDFYRKLRDEFNPESCTIARDRSVLAERIIDYAKEVLYARPVEVVPYDIAFYRDRPGKHPIVSWPSLFGEEVHRGVPQLRLLKKYIVPQGRALARVSIPEAMQWILAFESFMDEEERNFTNKDSVFGDFVSFYLESEVEINYPRISFMADIKSLRDVARFYIKKAGGSKIDRNRATAGKLIADSIGRYTILIESIRQQICTGVGLRCPFWTGSGCCEFRPLLQQTYDICEPWHPLWKHHWQRAPCLA